jgi:hypothetical protein
MRKTIFALAILAVACKKKEETLMLPTPPVVTLEKECYVWTSGKDTIRLSFVRSENVTGELSYDFFEKDKSRGTLSGMFIGDTLFADYRFHSEGTVSVREIVFLRKGDSIVPGSGPIELRDGRESFSGLHQQLKFDSSQALGKVDCP